MTNCNQIEIKFPGCQRREVEASFTGGDVSSYGGVLLLRQADRKLELTGSVAKALTETRRKKSCHHSLVSILRQRVYGLCLGYEDLNDHNTMRWDAALQTAVQRDDELAGASTLCRWENISDRETAWAIHSILVE